MQLFKPGQRWYSSAEPELGLGTILRADARQVDIVYTGCGELKQYTVATAPLIRGQFAVDDLICFNETLHSIDAVSEADELLHYHCGEDTLIEGALDPEQPFIPPALRLLLNQSDESHLFDLRRQCLLHANACVSDDAEQESFEALLLELLSHYGCSFSPLSAHQFILDASQLRLTGFDALKAQETQGTFIDDAAQNPQLTYFNHSHPLFIAACQDFLQSRAGSASFMVDDSLHPRSVVLESVFTDAARSAHCFAVDAKLNLLPQYAPNEQAVFRARNREIDLKPFKRSLELIYPSLMDASQRAAQTVHAGKLQALRLVAGSEFAAFGKTKR